MKFEFLWPLKIFDLRDRQSINGILIHIWLALPSLTVLSCFASLDGPRPWIELCPRFRFELETRLCRSSYQSRPVLDKQFFCLKYGENQIYPPVQMRVVLSTFKFSSLIMSAHPEVLQTVTWVVLVSHGSHVAILVLVCFCSSFC